MEGSNDTNNWLGLASETLPVHEAADWVVLPECGASVLFTGTARDHSPGREGVSSLNYEAYAEHAVPRLEAVALEARKRWPTVGRIALLHRVGPVLVTEAAVVVAVSSAHRSEAFAAARFCIDLLKETVPIWKKETWQDGSSWGLEPQHLVEVDSLSSTENEVENG